MNRRRSERDNRKNIGKNREKYFHYNRVTKSELSIDYLIESCVVLFWYDARRNEMSCGIGYPRPNHVFGQYEQRRSQQKPGIRTDVSEKWDGH